MHTHLKTGLIYGPSFDIFSKIIRKMCNRPHNMAGEVSLRINL